MTIGKRIRIIRKDLNMSQQKFGETLGVTRDVINNLECDRNKTNNEALLRFICKTHKVNYSWLMDGSGDPLLPVSESNNIDELISKYSLDKEDTRLIMEYINLEPAARLIIKNYMKSVFREEPD